MNEPRKPTKAQTDRLRQLVDDFRYEEMMLSKRFGDAITPGSMRAKRIKDADALEAVILFLKTC